MTATVPKSLFVFWSTWVDFQAAVKFSTDASVGASAETHTPASHTIWHLSMRIEGRSGGAEDLDVTIRSCQVKNRHGASGKDGAIFERRFS